jgi:uncharacterized membrane protein
MDNIGFFIKALIIVFVVLMTFNVAGGATEKSLPALSLLFSLIGTFLNLIFGIGMIKISLKFCDNETPELKDLFAGFNANLFFSYLLVSILYTLIVIGGLFLVIVFAFIWGVEFQFCTYLVIDKGMDPVSALKTSSAITRGTKLQLFFFGLLLILINIVGILALGIGIFVTLPLSMVAIAWVYRRLLQQSETLQPVGSEKML